MDNEDIKELVSRLYLKFYDEELKWGLTESKTKLLGDCLGYVENQYKMPIEALVKWWIWYCKDYDLVIKPSGMIRADFEFAIKRILLNRENIFPEKFNQENGNRLDLEKIRSRIQKSSQEYFTKYHSMREDEDKYLLIQANPLIYSWWKALHYPCLVWGSLPDDFTKRLKVINQFQIGKQIMKEYEKAMYPFNTWYWLKFYKKENSSAV